MTPSGIEPAKVAINTFKLPSWLLQKLSEASLTTTQSAHQRRSLHTNNAVCTPTTQSTHQLLYVTLLSVYWFIFHRLSNMSGCTISVASHPKPPSDISLVATRYVPENHCCCEEFLVRGITLLLDLLSLKLLLPSRSRSP